MNLIRAGERNADAAVTAVKATEPPKYKYVSMMR
jgi:hypothetical protein